MSVPVAAITYLTVPYTRFIQSSETVTYTFRFPNWGYMLIGIIIALCGICIGSFWNLLNALDIETNYMMYEPEERAQSTNIQELSADIRSNVINGNDFLQVASEDNKIVGYIRAERGRLRRNFHTAYIVVGILKACAGKGIGTTFFKKLDLLMSIIWQKFYKFDWS